MVKLARILKMRPLELNQRFVGSGGQVEVKLEIRDCAEVSKKISALDIPFILDQDLLRDYSRIMDCPYVSGAE